MQKPTLGSKFIFSTQNLTGLVPAWGRRTEKCLFGKSLTSAMEVGFLPSYSLKSTKIIIRSLCRNQDIVFNKPFVHFQPNLEE